MPPTMPTMPHNNAKAIAAQDMAAHSGLDLLNETAAEANQKPMSFWQLLNISIGFLGIRFAWMIQMGQMPRLLETLGSAEWLTPILFCAGPITGIVVQPIVGSWSDKTWTPLGRRRPFLLTGAILTAICLLLMPNSEWLGAALGNAVPAIQTYSLSLIIAATLLWVLDAAINVSQGPYRALVPDVVPQKQQAFTYTLMGFTIGLGSVAAAIIGTQAAGMHSLFYLGAASMLLAMGWTIVTTPETKRETNEEASSSGGFMAFIGQTWASIAEMPTSIKKLCIMHSFTWFGWQCMFIFFALFVTHNIFQASDKTSALYDQAGQHVFLCYATLNIVCFVVSPFIGKLCEIFSKKAVHTFGLLCLAGGLISALFITEPIQAQIAMGVIGVGWATTLAVPFAILAAKAPAGKEGVLMGTFNIFIAAPQFVASGATSLLMAYTHNNAYALVLGGIAVIVSAFLLQWVDE